MASPGPGSQAPVLAVVGTERLRGGSHALPPGPGQLEAVSPSHPAEVGTPLVAASGGKTYHQAPVVDERARKRLIGEVSEQPLSGLLRKRRRACQCAGGAGDRRTFDYEPFHRPTSGAAHRGPRSGTTGRPQHGLSDLRKVR